MKRARRATAWGVGLLVLVAACVPPGEPEKAPEARPATAAEAAKPKPEVKPTPEPAPPAVKPDAVYVFSPQQRRRFAAGEMAELTVVVCAASDLPAATLTVTVRDPQNTAWATTDALGTLPAGRHARSYGIAVGQFPPGDYKLAVDVAGRSSEALELTIASAVPRTHFRIGGWVEKPPRDARDAARWARALGLNTVLLQNRSPWGAQGTVDAGYGARCEKLRKARTAKPLELDGEAPPFTRAADLLTGAGLEWMNACAVSGGGQPDLRPDRSFADPAVVRGARQRIHHRLVAERAFARCAGIHFTDEATLAWHRAATYEGPFGVPARLAAFKAATGAKDVPWQRGATWDGWQQFMAWRAGVVGRALADWAGAVRSVEPDYVATSQLYWPTRLDEGAYPPLGAQGLPVVTTQAGLDGPAGMMMPAVVADLQRMGNWDKPLWFMPELTDDAGLDEVRAALSLALARKIDGVVYPPSLDYRLDRPGAGPLPLQLIEGLSGLNARLTRLGDFLLALDKPRHDVAILYSATEHAARIGKSPAKAPRAASYPWTLIGAYEACMFAHFAPTFLSEEELLAGEGDRSRVVLVIGLTAPRPEVKGALERLAASGVAVLKSLDTQAALEGSAELPVRFANLHAYHDELWRKGEQEKVDTTLERRDEVAQSQLIYPDLARLRKTLKEHVARDFTVSDKTVIVCDQRAGAGRYLFVVNNEQRTDIFRGLKWELRPSKTRVTLRKLEGGYKAYDVFGGSRILTPYVAGYPVVNLVLAAGSVDCVALLPAVIQGVYIGQARLRGGAIELQANVHAAEPRKSWWAGPKPRRSDLRVPLDAAVPIEIRIRDGGGKLLHHLYRAHTPTGYRERIPVPVLATPGDWTVEVREMLSGKRASTVVEVAAPKAPSWLRRRGRLVAFDGDRIAALLRAPQPLWIVVGTPEEARKAEPLAQALASAERPVEIKLAAGLAKPRRLDPAASAVYVSPAPDNKAMPDVRLPATLLGDVTTHPLLQAVCNYGLLPRTLSPDHPGPGGALLCWQRSAFEPDVDTVVAAAVDAAGVDQAIAALRAAAGGAAPRTAWAAVAGAPPAPDTRFKPTIQQLASVWRNTTLDNPVAAVLPPGSASIAVGCHDGQVTAYDVIGKALWSHWGSSRCRSVAASFDGSWTAYGSFPEVGYLTARGRVQWAVPIEESSHRADHTAVAMSLSGELTVAGTRRGKVRAFDMDGRQVFLLGDADADERAEGWQSRFGTINAIAITPKIDMIVVAGDNELAAFDITGEQLWATTDLRRVISLTVSLAEEPAILVGSRDGYVAVLDKQGAVTWRAPAGGYVTSACFRGTTGSVLAACLDGTLTCYDEKGKVVWRRRSPVGFRHVACSIDGEAVAAAEFAGKVLLINAAGDVFAETPPLQGIIRVMALSADGSYLLVGTAANELALFRYDRPKADEDIL